MPPCRLDHIALACRSLAGGVAQFEQRSGITLPDGGEHALMATHNRVGRLDKDLYLEIIAANPDAQAERPRWFALDSPPARGQLRVAGLAPWCAIVETPDLAATLGHLQAVEPAYRDWDLVAMARGDLRWLFALPPEGGMAAGGLLPYLIERPGAESPAHRLPPQGLSLVRLTLAAPEPARIARTFEVLGLAGDPRLAVEEAPEAHLRLALETPKGSLLMQRVCLWDR